uniref:helix-turn-helix domain-containing protein n=1 Tax=Pseudomonas fluorescens TaxID=294 RepID=UPI001F254B1E|nr:helix-turn-helix domain-containing protein [Pseudomonas fluorescens]
MTTAKHGSNPVSKSYAMHVGRRIQEADIGTTAPSLALKEKKFIALSAAEHYLEEFKNMFCCASPIWGPWGKIVGTLNITGSENFRSRLIEKKIQTAAMKIENRIFLETHKNNEILKIHFDQEFINTHLAGLISVNAYGDILSATRNALEMLEDIDPIHKQQSIGDIFLGDIVPTGEYCLKSAMRNGVVFYIQSYQKDPGASLDVVEKSGVRSGGSVRELSDLHILETIKRSGGNISKAAEQLELSRTTLYRVLHRQRPAPGADRSPPTLMLPGSAPSLPHVMHSHTCI